MNEKQYTYEDLKDMFFFGPTTFNVMTPWKARNLNKFLRKFLNIDGLKIIKPLLAKTRYKDVILTKEDLKNLVICAVCYIYVLRGKSIKINYKHYVIKKILDELGGEHNILECYSLVKLPEYDKCIESHYYQIVRRVNLLDDAKETMAQNNKTVYNFMDQIKPIKKEVKITEQEHEKSIVDRLAKERSLERKNKELEERINQLEIKVDRVIELVSAVDDKTIIMAKMIRLLNEKDNEAQKLRA